MQKREGMSQIHSNKRVSTKLTEATQVKSKEEKGLIQRHFWLWLLSDKVKLRDSQETHRTFNIIVSPDLPT